VRDVLERGGYAVAEARDGAEALRFLERDVPLLVISDIVMPQADGFGRGSGGPA
jgi:CheY-like chemotaxis protein